MNQRIEKLLEQARTECSQFGSKPATTVGYDELEKFAQLIVKECAEVIAPMGDWCGGHGEPSMPSTMECAKRLKEHFGVEE